MPVMHDAMTIGACAVAVAASVLMVVRFRIHPFLSLMLAATVLAFALGSDLTSAVGSVQKGFGDVMGGAGIAIALGLMLGAMLDLSGAAHTLAAALLSTFGRKRARWGALLASMLVGLPLFFETGVVLLIPVVAAAAAVVSSDGKGGPASSKMAILLSGLAGLSVLHCLLPPHPGPLLAASQLGANVGLTMLYGLLVAVPTAIVAGPVFGTMIARFVTPSESTFPPVAVPASPPPLRLAAAIILLPVVLIAGGELVRVTGTGAWRAGAVMSVAGNPIVALMITNVVALIALFGMRADYKIQSDRVWSEAMKPAGTILLSIGAGGALKQVLIDGGIATMLARFAQESSISPLLLGWLVAVAIRLATGSATVATVTAAGVMTGIARQGGVSTEWLVLAIGTGSVFLSQVSDPGFWLVKGYLGTSTADTLRSWSAMETLISVLGIGLILVFSAVI